MELFATRNLLQVIRCVSFYQTSVSEVAPLSIKQDLYFIHSSHKNLLRRSRFQAIIKQKMKSKAQCDHAVIQIWWLGHHL